jgi:hypothetical protein
VCVCVFVCACVCVCVCVCMCVCVCVCLCVSDIVTPDKVEVHRARCPSHSLAATGAAGRVVGCVAISVQPEGASSFADKRVMFALFSNYPAACYQRLDRLTHSLTYSLTHSLTHSLTVTLTDSLPSMLRSDCRCSLSPLCAGFLPATCREAAAAVVRHASSAAVIGRLRSAIRPSSVWLFHLLPDAWRVSFSRRSTTMVRLPRRIRKRASRSHR